jgi:hypothetical protein
MSSMMKTNPITPPPELRQLWAQQAQRMNPRDPIAWQEHIANQAAQWGANQEMEAILEMVGVGQQSLPEEDRYLDGFTVASIRNARRPKPPSLKKQALEALQFVDEKLDLPLHNHCNAIHTIRRALESLDD